MVSSGDVESQNDSGIEKKKEGAASLFKKRVAAGKNFRRRGRAEDSAAKKEACKSTQFLDASRSCYVRFHRGSNWKSSREAERHFPRRSCVNVL